MFDRARKTFARFLTSTRAEPSSSPQRRPHNLFEAAAVYVSARAEDDQDRIEEGGGLGVAGGVVLRDERVGMPGRRRARQGA